MRTSVLVKLMRLFTLPWIDNLVLLSLDHWRRHLHHRQSWPYQYPTGPCLAKFLSISKFHLSEYLLPSTWQQLMKLCVGWSTLCRKTIAKLQAQCWKFNPPCILCRRFCLHCQHWFLLTQNRDFRMNLDSKIFCSWNIRQNYLQLSWSNHWKVDIFGNRSRRFTRYHCIKLNSRACCWDDCHGVLSVWL